MITPHTTQEVMSVATRELVPYFVPSDGAPSVNEALAVFEGARTFADASEVDTSVTRARVWDKSQGFFVPSSSPSSSSSVSPNQSAAQRSVAPSPQQQSPKLTRRAQSTPQRIRAQQKQPAHRIEPETDSAMEIAQAGAGASRKQRRQRRNTRTRPEQIVADGTSTLPNGIMPAALTPAEASPQRKRFAGCTFETASPEPHVLPVPRFVRIAQKDHENAHDGSVGTDVASATAVVGAASATADRHTMSQNELASLDLRRMLKI